MMLIIGYGNKARQGKDTAAEAVRDYYDSRNNLYRRHVNDHQHILNVHIMKYANALYQETNEYLEIGQNLGISTAELFQKGVRDIVGGKLVVTPIPEWVTPDPVAAKSTLAPYGKHPKLLQWWGTDYRRWQNPEYWVEKTFAAIPTNADIVLITDVRFPNEAAKIRQQGGYLVNVQRLTQDGRPFLASDRPADHASEIALDGFNWDLYIKSKHPVITAEVAITYAEYLRGLHGQAKKS